MDDVQGPRFPSAETSEACERDAVAASTDEATRVELARLRARVRELEEQLASRERESERHDDQQRRAEFQNALYEAVLYGLARTLSLYDPPSVSLLVREMGRRIREYLEELGYHVGGGKSVEEVVEQTVAFFVTHGFVELEMVSWEDDLIRARWRGLLGLRAYERIVAAEAETFVSCPLNAILQDSLEAFGKELTLVRKEFDLDKDLVESWEAIVDLAPPESEELSLNGERLLELEREQSRQLRVREDFIRIASHELATPLTSTKLAVARLEAAALPDGPAKAVGVLKRQLGRLEHLVTEMLDATQLQIGRVRMQLASVDLVPIVRNVVEALGGGLQRDLRGQINLVGDAAVVGTWDGARLEQVLTNIIGNAVKYGDGHAIVIETTARDGHVQIRVRDQGIGIEPEAMKRLFRPFERAVSVQHYGGLGLGLYISRRIVQMHGGTLSVESEPSSGTTFTITLPLVSRVEARVLVSPPSAARREAS